LWMPGPPILQGAKMDPVDEWESERARMIPGVQRNVIFF